eukprot:CAMPEP_0174828708 /NCGR_PEP_ID=MMETSP1114-20130205/1494_1 /TAXON_ID=312471 /ORGANISM="Neobodo designis, Strain CCAP 1951/1" /LENGTH=676 /DNA_ID=CAMNT_0016062433 /DNA_START=79 /DNA_END=2109 /DNA_ORIENTATION=+
MSNSPAPSYAAVAARSPPEADATAPAGADDEAVPTYADVTAALPKTPATPTASDNAPNTYAEAARHSPFDRPPLRQATDEPERPEPQPTYAEVAAAPGVEGPTNGTGSPTSASSGTRKHDSDRADDQSGGMLTSASLGSSRDEMRTDENDDVQRSCDRRCEKETHEPYGVPIESPVVEEPPVFVKTEKPPADGPSAAVMAGGGDGGAAADAAADAAEAKAADGDVPGKQPIGGATIGSSVFNLAASAIGAGALAFPYAFAKLGIVPGLIVMVGSAAMGVYTIDVLIRLVEALNAPTYEGLGHAIFGNKGRHAVGGTVFSLTFGFACVYVVLVGQFISPVLEVASEDSNYPPGAWGRRLCVTLIWLVLMLPFCLMRSIDSLKFISTGAVFATAFVIVALIAHAATHVSPEEADARVEAAASPSIEVIQAITNMKVGFTGQVVSFAVYNEMGGATVPRMLKATSIAMATCAVIYFIVGISGVIAVGLDAPENVLEAFADPLGQWYTIIAYMAMLVVIIVSFPIMVFPARDAVLAMIGYETSYASPDHVRLGVSVAIAFCALVIGLFVPGLNLLFGVIGGISGNLISNVLPAVFALKSGEWTVEKVGKVQRVAIFVPLLYGIIVGPLGLAVSIYLTFRPDDDGSASPQPSVNNASAVQAANTTANALTGLASMARLTAP